MNAYELADELENKPLAYGNDIQEWLIDSANMLRKQADRISELEDRLSMYEIKDLDRGIIGRTKDYAIHDLVYRTTPQIKELSDEELNKAFDYYCETDEGVLRFNYQLRDEWKKEQLIRWKEALKKASEK